MNDIVLFLDGISTKQPKELTAQAITVALRAVGISVQAAVLDKPWGIELKIVESDTKSFLKTIFMSDELPSAVVLAPYGGKILVIEAARRLSWHVHERKDAFLKIVSGEALVYTSPTDEQPAAPSFRAGKGMLVHIPELIRHRLEGGIGSGVIVAEISRNVFPEHPSDDADERRISDDYGRK